MVDFPHFTIAWLPQTKTSIEKMIGEREWKPPKKANLDDYMIPIMTNDYSIVMFLTHDRKWLLRCQGTKRVVCSRREEDKGKNRVSIKKLLSYALSIGVRFLSRTSTYERTVLSHSLGLVGGQNWNIFPVRSSK